MIWGYPYFRKPPRCCWINRGFCNTKRPAACRVPSRSPIRLHRWPRWMGHSDVWAHWKNTWKSMGKTIGKWWNNWKTIGKCLVISWLTTPSKYMCKCHTLLLPVGPRKAVPEVSKIGHYRRGELLWRMDGRANPLMDRNVVAVVLCYFCWCGCNGCSGHLTHNCWM